MIISLRKSWTKWWLQSPYWTVVAHQGRDSNLKLRGLLQEPQSDSSMAHTLTVTWKTARLKRGSLRIFADLWWVIIDCKSLYITMLTVYLILLWLWCLWSWSVLVYIYIYIYIYTYTYIHIYIYYRWWWWCWWWWWWWSPRIAPSSHCSSVFLNVATFGRGRDSTNNSCSGWFIMTLPRCHSKWWSLRGTTQTSLCFSWWDRNSFASLQNKLLFSLNTAGLTIQDLSRCQRTATYYALHIIPSLLLSRSGGNRSFTIHIS